MDTVFTQARAAIGPYGIATPTAREAVLIANTPAFLLDRLRKDMAVQFVLDNMSIPEILLHLKKGLANRPSDAVSLVPLYVYLIALSTTDPHDSPTWREIRSLDLSHLEWGDSIRNLICAEAIPTTTFEFTLPSPPPR
jgi:hypothetical protein